MSHVIVLLCKWAAETDNQQMVRQSEISVYLLPQEFESKFFFSSSLFTVNQGWFSLRRALHLRLEGTWSIIRQVTHKLGAKIYIYIETCTYCIIIGR